MHQVTLVFEDGRTAQIAADESETIYLAALKNRIRIETDCREGACGTCKGLCTHGEYRLDDHSDEALSDAEAAGRYVLTCQMHPTSDCVIEFPYESALALKGGPETRSGRVAEATEVASSVVRLVVEVDDTTGPISFLPGQYVHLSVPGSHEHRSYSFANPPTETNRLEFYVKVLDQGAMSAYVTGRAQPGDNMAITGPFGRFYLRPPARPLLMVAGGTGLAPMLSMLAVIGAAGSNQPVHLLYGANRPQELFALEQLEGYADRGVNLTTELAVVEGGPGWDGPTGHITDRLRPDVIYRGDCDVYLCGPPPMIDAGRSWLLANGTETARIHTETFLAS